MGFRGIEGRGEISICALRSIRAYGSVLETSSQYYFEASRFLGFEGSGFLWVGGDRSVVFAGFEDAEVFGIGFVGVES